MNLEELKKLAGVKAHNNEINKGSNISLTGMEKSKLMKKHNIKPGTPEWFRLWFTKPYLTNTKPI
jgi:hypothetical protein